MLELVALSQAWASVSLQVVNADVSSQVVNADVVIYGGTPAGVSAAIACRRTANLSVVLLEPSRIRIGGMTAGGLGHTDLGMAGKELGGITREFYQRVSMFYTGSNETQCFLPESHVAEAVYNEMLLEAGVDVVLDASLTAVHKSSGSRIRQVQTNSVSVSASAFVDASYEGDLMARAGASYTIGRESRAVYGEENAGRLAPNNVISRYQFNQQVNYTTEDGKLLPLIFGGSLAPIGGADKNVEAYCFRPCMAKIIGGRAIPFTPPTSYDPLQWQLFRNLLSVNPPDKFKASDFLYFSGPLGNSSGDSSKYDVGTSGPINLDWIGASWTYPDANASERARLVDAHVEYSLGFLHFLSTDAGVPATLREDVRSWGFCADEFASAKEAHFPRSSLYVREARRMVGARVLTERDRTTERAKADR